MRWPTALVLLVALAAPLRADTISQQLCSADKASAEFGDANSNVILGGLFQMRGPGSDGKGCDTPVVDLMQTLEAAKYTIEELNRANFVDGVKFSMRVFDTCQQTSVVLKSLHELYPQTTANDPFSAQCNTTNKVLLGTVGPISSGAVVGAAQASAGFARPIPATMISPRAMSTGLSDIPTFFRTSPSFSVMGKVISEVLKSLEWESSVLIIYAADSGGLNGYESVIQEASARGICISKVVAVPMNALTKDTIKTALGSLGDKTFAAGVVIGDSQFSNLVLRAVDETPTLASTQWIFSDLDLSSDLESVARARGAIAVYPSSPQVGGFRDYFKPLMEQDPSLYTLNPWWQEWYEAKYNCKINPTGLEVSCQIRANANVALNSFVQSAWVVPTMKAVAAFSGAARITCQRKAPGQSCADFLRTVSPVDIRNALRTLDRIPADFPIEELRNVELKFDANGDIVQSDYSVYGFNNFGGSPYSFKEIGQYSNGALTLNSNVLFYSADRSTQLTATPQSPCPPEGCNNCVRPQRQVTFRYTDGDLVIASLVNGHSPSNEGFGCGAALPTRLAALVASEWAAAEYKNRNPTKLNGVRLGSLTADICPDGPVAAAFLADLLTNNRLVGPTGAAISSQNIYGFVDHTDSRQAMVVSPILASQNIPEIQTNSVPTMTPQEIGNVGPNAMGRQPYLTHAVPTQEENFEALSIMLVRLDWKYVQVVAENSDMYQLMADSFRMQAGRHGICVTEETSLTAGDAASLSTLMRRLNNAAPVVVVVMAGQQVVDELLRAREDTGMNANIQLVFATGDWYLNPPAVRTGSEGSLLMDLEASVPAGLSQWLGGLTRAQVKANAFLTQLFEAGDVCTSDEACSTAKAASSSAYLRWIMEGKTAYVVDSVFAMADKLHEIIEEMCGSGYSGLCPQFRSSMDVRSQLDTKLQNVPEVSGFGIKDGRSVTDLFFYRYSSSQFTEIERFDTSAQRLAGRDLTSVKGSIAPQCPGACLECQYLFTLQAGLFQPGDWLIGGLFGVSNPGPKEQQPYICGAVRQGYGPQYTTAMMYALSQVNANSAPVSVKGATLGGFSLDHCSNEGRSSLLVSGAMASRFTMTGVEDTNILSWVTDRTDATIEAQTLLKPLGVSIVSASATSRELTDESNFYRTVQGDQTLASALVKMIKTLGYPYFQVVYSSSAYGVGGLEAVTTSALTEGVCLTQSFMINSTAPASTDAIVESLVASETEVVVVFADTEDMSALMGSIQRSIEARRSLLLLLADPFDNLMLTAAPQLSRRVLSLRLRTGVLDKYNQYLKSAPIENPYFAQYYMELQGCNLPGYSTYSNSCPTPLVDITTMQGYTQDNYVLATINAVYASVDALDRTIRYYCTDDYTAPCAEFLTAADWRKRYNNNLANVNFVDEANNNFRFLDQEGNTAYDILQTGTNGRYNKVGLFGGISVEMDAADTTSYRDVQSQCTAPCTTCIVQTLDFSFTPGDVYLAGVFDVHEASDSPFTCGQVKTLHGMLLLEAFHYALKQVNGKDGQFADILPGVTLGGVGLDACSSEIRAGQIVSNINNGLTSLAREGERIFPDNIDAYIGSYGSRSSMYLARILRDLEVPQISYAAGNPDLSDERYYPFFYRTVPSDNNMVEAILKFLDANDIRYVQVVFEQSTNAIATKNYFVRMAAEYRVCVAEEVNYPDINTVSAETANQVVARLVGKPAANTVVTFLNAALINSMLRAVSRSERASSNFRFIGSDGWADNQDAIFLTGQQAVNSVTVKLDSDDLQGFESYINTRTLANTAEENPWFGEYFQRIHNCYTSKVDTLGYPRPCAQTPGDTINQPNYQQDQGVTYVIDAVYAAAFALHKTLQQKCGDGYSAVCQAYRSESQRREMLRDNLKDVNFTDPLGSEFRFVNRSGSYGYRYYSIDAGVQGSAFYNQIGRYDVASQELMVNPNWKDSVSSNCQRVDACAECPLIRDNSVRHVVFDLPPTAAGSSVFQADAPTIVAFFDIHQQGVDPYRCGPINPRGFMQFLSFFYTLEKVIQGTLRGSNSPIRVVAIDTCSNHLRVDQDLYGLLTGDGLCNSKFDSGIALRLDNLGAVVTSGNLNTAAAARVLERSKVTYLSPDALSMGLDGHESLLRTVAPSSAALHAFTALAEKMGWSFMDILYEGNTESLNMAQQLTDLGYRQRMCFGSSQAVLEDASSEEIESTLSALSAQSGSRVIVLIGSQETSRRILSAARSVNLADRFLWVLLGEWDPTTATMATLRSAAGSSAKLVTVRRMVWPVPTFSQHVESLSYADVHSSNSQRNIPTQWFDEFYQIAFDCTLAGSARPLPGRPACDTTKMLERSMWAEDPFVVNTVMSAYAAGTGLREVLNRCAATNCLLGQTVTRDTIRELMLAVTLDLRTNGALSANNINTEFRFDQTNRWWDQGHVITYWDGQGQGIMINITEAEGMQPLQAAFPQSRCELTVEQGACGCDVPGLPSAQALSVVMGPSFTPEDHRNYYEYKKHVDPVTGVRDKRYDWPLWALPVAALTVLGIITTLILFLVLLCAYPVRGGTSILGYMVIVGIILIYGINFAFFLHATDAVCGIRRFLMGVVYMVALAPLLVKAVDNWRFNHVEKVEGRYSGISSACSLVLMAVGLVLIQCIVPIMWLILRHPTASKQTYGLDMKHDNWWCDPADDYDLGLVLSFSFVVFVVFMTAGFSTRSFDSSRNSFESRWIFFSCVATAGCFLVWMVVTTNALPPYRDPTIAIANFVNATLLLCTMPLRKSILMCRALKQRSEEKEAMEVYARNGVMYGYNGHNGQYDNPTYELNDYDNMDSKSEDF